MNPNTLLKRKRWELPTMEELENFAIDDMIELQEILAQQVAVLNRIASGNYDDATKRLAEKLLSIKNKEYWEVDEDIDQKIRAARAS